MSSYLKPDNALKKAEELNAINMKNDALNILDRVVRRRIPFSLTLEKIIRLELSLCIELRKGKVAKDALTQFRNACGTSEIESLRGVVESFLREAEEKAEKAQKKADKIVLDVEDLDVEEGEVNMFSAVGEDLRDRTDKEHVTPWLKLVWETYRTVLEILKNHRLEDLYQKTAQRAFQFCLRYKRPMEFKRVCDTLRLHLTNMQRNRPLATDQQTITTTTTGAAANLSSSSSTQIQQQQQQQQQTFTSSMAAMPVTQDTVALALETRFAQLDVAMALELWSEAFRSLEDVHGLLLLARKVSKQQQNPVSASTLSGYFQRLSKVFWISKSYFFHAYALNKHWQYVKNINNSNSGKQQEEEEEESSRDEYVSIGETTVLAVLSVSSEQPRHSGEVLFDFDVHKERNHRMGLLLSTATTTTTTAATTATTTTTATTATTTTTATAVHKNLNLLAHDVAHRLIALISQHQHQPSQPYHIHPTIAALLPLLTTTTSHPTTYATLLNPLNQYAQTKPHLQPYILPVAKAALLNLIQHLSKVYDIMKISELKKLTSFLSWEEVEKNIVEFARKRFVDLRIDHQAGFVRFNIAAISEQQHLRYRIASFANNLQNALLMLQQQGAIPSQPSGGEEKKKKYFENVLKNIEQEREQILARKAAIEKKKEEQEAEARRKSEIKENARREKIKKEEEEQIRLFAEQTAERELQQKQREQEEQKKKRLNSLVESLKKTGQTFDQQSLDQLAQGSIDPEEFLKRKMSEHQQSQKLRMEEVKGAGKAADWAERARREKEADRVAVYARNSAAAQKLLYTAQTDAYTAAHKINWLNAFKTKNALNNPLLYALNTFNSNLIDKRKKINILLDQQRQERIAQKRKIIIQEIEEQNRKDEEKRQEEARKKKQEDDIKAAKAKEEEGKMRRYKEQEEIQRKKTEEIERKLAENEKKISANKYVPPSQRNKFSAVENDEEKKESEEKLASSSNKWIPPSLKDREIRQNNEKKDNFNEKERKERFERRDSENKFERRDNESRFERRDSENKFERRESENRPHKNEKTDAKPKPWIPPYQINKENNEEKNPRKEDESKPEKRDSENRFEKNEKKENENKPEKRDTEKNEKYIPPSQRNKASSNETPKRDSDGFIYKKH